MAAIRQRTGGKFERQVTPWPLSRALPDCIAAADARAAANWHGKQQNHCVGSIIFPVAQGFGPGGIVRQTLSSQTVHLQGWRISRCTPRKSGQCTDNSEHYSAECPPPQVRCIQVCHQLKSAGASFTL